jgi:hypothetical protein
MSFGITSLIYFRNAQGESWAERGISNLNLSAGGKTFVRLLALIGANHVIILAALWIPMQFFAAHGDRPNFPVPAYFTNGASL